MASTGKTYDVKTAPATQYELSPVIAKRSVRRNTPQANSRKLVIRGQKVQIEYVDRDGVKSYFNIGGKRIR